MIETIALAAIRVGTKIFTGPHHGVAYLAAIESGLDAFIVETIGTSGFVTSTGRFVDRGEAVEIGATAGQKMNREHGRVGSHGTITPSAAEIRAAQSAGTELELLGSYAQLVIQQYGDAAPLECRRRAASLGRACDDEQAVWHAIAEAAEKALASLPDPMIGPAQR